ncbi:hypothetical protein WJX74_004390 [Apatococcus lobatus]
MSSVEEGRQQGDNLGSGLLREAERRSGMGSETERKQMKTTATSVAIRFVVVAVSMFLLDLVWILGISKYIFGLDYFGTLEGIQGSSVAGRPFGLVAYLSLTYAAAIIASTPWEAAQQGFVIYSVFDSTSTYIYHGWGYKIAILDTLWGTLLFTILGFIVQELRKRTPYVQ